MKKVTKKVFWGFEPFDYRASEKYLENKSRKGEKLENISGYMAEFSQDEPCERVFRANVFYGAYTENGKGKKEAYLNSWREAGWQFCAENDIIYYFYKDGTDKKLPEGIGSEESKLLLVSVWRREFYSALIMFLALAFGLISQTRMTYLSLLTYIDFCKTSLFILFIIPSALMFIYHAVVFLRCRTYIKRGEPLPEPGLKSAYLRSIIVYAPSILFLLYVLASFVCDASISYPYIALAAAPLALIAFVVWMFKLMAGKIKKSFYITGMIVALAVCAAVFNMSYTNLAHTGNSLPEGYYALRLAEVNDTLETTSTLYSHTDSPIIKNHYVYTETASNGTKVSTEYIDCVNNRCADFIYKLVQEALEGVEVTYTLERVENAIIYCEVKPAE